MSYERVNFDHHSPIRKSDARLDKQYPAHEYRLGTSWLRWDVPY